MAKRTVLAVDLGAESGRVMAVEYDGISLAMHELARFANTPVQIRDTLYWDFPRLWHEIQHGISAGRALQPASVGVDTWGVDFGLLDANGDLLANPVHYRDQRTNGMMQRVFARVDRATVFERTGIQFMPINTIYQLMSLVEQRSPLLEIAATLLTAPDLLNYWLTGNKVSEFTNATTTQLVDPRTRMWATDVLEALPIPTHLFAPIVAPGTRIGTFHGLPVIAPACHDTGSSVVAVPTTTPNYAYISSGTWSLVGLEVREPVINAAALAANVTNEGGVDGTYRLLKNVMGLWIVQQCRATWAAEGSDYSYAELVELAEAAPPLRSLINPNAACFLPAGDHPRLIQQWCADHEQPIPQTHGAIVRCVLESLALAYRAVLETLQDLATMRCETLHVVGGGARNHVLNQMTADATGIPVVAGPVESTVLGNALVQLMALGEFGSLAEVRQLVATHHDVQRYEPRHHAAWDAAYADYRTRYAAADVDQPVKEERQ